MQSLLNKYENKLKFAKSQIFHVFLYLLYIIFIFWVWDQRPGPKMAARAGPGPRPGPDRAGARRHFGPWAQVLGPKYEKNMK